VKTGGVYDRVNHCQKQARKEGRWCILRRLYKNFKKAALKG